MFVVVLPKIADILILLSESPQSAHDASWVDRLLLGKATIERTAIEHFAVSGCGDNGNVSHMFRPKNRNSRS